MQLDLSIDYKLQNCIPLNSIACGIIWKLCLWDPFVASVPEEGRGQRKWGILPPLIPQLTLLQLSFLNKIGHHLICYSCKKLWHSMEPQILALTDLPARWWTPSPSQPTCGKKGNMGLQDAGSHKHDRNTVISGLRIIPDSPQDKHAPDTLKWIWLHADTASPCFDY